MMLATSLLPGPLRRLSTMASSVFSRLGHRQRADHAAHVGRDDQQLLGLRVVLLDVVRQQRRGQQVVGGDVEEALDLAGVQIHRQHPVGAGAGDQVGHQLGRDRRAAAGLAVLAGVAEVGRHRR
jgi:hypothetical protein